MEAPMISSSLGAMSSILGKLDNLLESHHHLLWKQVRKGDIEVLKEDLEMINTFLLELSKEDDPNHTKKYWMKEVREVSYDIEDYIDKLMYSQGNIGSVGVPRVKISKLSSMLNRRPKIASQIRELRARLEDAGERHRRYVLDNNAPSSHSYGRSITKLHEEASRLLVGMDDSREKLIKLLDDGEKQLKVISIWGIGGIGKTTLAKQLLRDHAGQFGFRAFVRVSRKPDTRSVLRSILSQTGCHYAFDACSVQQLIARLKEHLQNRRYLIVIDDLWDTTVWDILLHAFSDGNHSSRIIATTAIKNVAMVCSDDQSDYVLRMEPINIDDSRILFFKRVFGSEDKCPQQFKDASYGIIRNCGGVPLAIINIAGLLASQPDNPDLWDYVQNSLGSNLSICPITEGTMNVINLVYNGLPHYLKTCLQYVTLYPENCTIWKDDLVRRWVAEGFISPKEGNDIEAVAESYFEELVYRGMIQPIDVNYNDKVLSVTVHNLVLDLLINKCTEDNFITTIDYSQNNRELSNKVRRLFLFFSMVKYAAKPSGVMLSQVRSLAFYGLIKCMPSVREFEYLRVLFLHFSGDCSGHTPFNLTGIRRLFQLRYLKVTCNFSLQLPTHMEGLYNLETLELDAKVTPLPADIVHLRRLMHLRLPSETNLPDEIGHMRSLRTLKCFDLCSSSEDNVRSLDELTNLEELQLIRTAVLSDTLDRNIEVLCSIIGSLCNLKSLVLVPGYTVTCGSSTSVIDSSSTSSPPVCLERFEMHPAVCIFSGIPEWMRSLRRLCSLKIAVTEFLQNDMDTLGGLPGLKILSLYVGRATVDRIVFNSGVFPALKCFKFRCTTLSFAFQEEAMPNLHKLKLCFKSHSGLIMMAGIVHLLKLREVAVRIGLATGEYNTQAVDFVSEVVKSSFEVAIGEHRRIPNFNIQCVAWADEDDSVPARNSIAPEGEASGAKRQRSSTSSRENSGGSNDGGYKHSSAAVGGRGGGGSRRPLWVNENTTEFISGIGQELAVYCLLRLPRSYYYDVACVNRSFYSLVRSGELYRLRRMAGVVEQMIYCSCNVLEWDGFDPCRKRWFSIPSMPPIECFTLADKESLAVGTNILVFGRTVEAHVVLRYSLLSNSWTTGEMMNTPRCFFGSASFGEKAIVAGGIGESGTLNSAELYDSETKTWATLPSMNRARQMCSGFFMDGKFYAIGGKTGKHNMILSCAEEFDLENGTWRLIPDMARGVNGGSGAPPIVAVVNNELYAAHNASKEIRKYDKENNDWITLGSLPGRYTSVYGLGLAFCSCGDMLIVVGGMSVGGRGAIQICSWVPNNGLPDWKIIGTRHSRSFVYNCAVMNC